MFKTPAARVGRLSAVLLTVTTLVAPALAAENVLTLLPAKSLGFVVVNRMSEVNEKLRNYAQELELPLPDLLELAKTSAGIQQGLDVEGTILLAAVTSVDGSEKIQDSEVLVALPVRDYAQFIGQFHGDTASVISEVEVAGMPALVAEKSSYALLVPSDSEHRTLLQECLDRDPEMPSAVAALQEWIAENDTAVVVLSPGIQLLTEQGILALEQVKEHFSGNEELGGQAAQLAAAFDLYTQMLQGVKDKVRVAADGLLIDDVGNIRLGSRIRFTENGLATSSSDTTHRSTDDLLAGLPGGAFVGAVGASLSPECGELLAKWSVDMMKHNPALYGIELSDEAADKYLELALASMKGFRGFSMVFSASEAGAAIFDGMLAIFSTDDASDYLANYEEAMEQFQELIKDSDSAMPFAMEITTAEIAGAKGLKVSMDMGAMLAAQEGQPEAAEMMKKMFGPHGKLTTHVLAVEKSKVLFSYGSEQAIAGQIAALQSGEPDLAKEASIKKAVALLPKGADMVAFLSPRGAVAWFSSLLPPEALGNFAEFPETPAIGFSAKMDARGLQAEWVVPAEFPQAVKAYVESAQQ